MSAQRANLRVSDNRTGVFAQPRNDIFSRGNFAKKPALIDLPCRASGGDFFAFSPENVVLRPVHTHLRNHRACWSCLSLLVQPQPYWIILASTAAQTFPTIAHLHWDNSEMMENINENEEASRLTSAREAIIDEVENSMKRLRICPVSIWTVLSFHRGFK